MGYRLLLDENIEHEVIHRLKDDNHDVEHVDLLNDLGKGTSDEALAGYSRRTNRAIVTYDDDFVNRIPPGDYRAVLFFEDDSLSAREVADILHEMSLVYDYNQVRGLQKTGREWL